MSNIIRRASSFIKKFDPDRATKEAALTYITAAGFFSNQVEGLENLQGEDFIENFAKFCMALVPFANAKKDRYMSELLRRYLENYESYKRDVDFIKNYKDITVNSNDGENTKSILSEVNFTINLKHQMLITDGMLVLSKTYEKLEYRTIILDKPYILGQPQSGEFYDPSRGLKSGDKKDKKYYPGEIKPNE